MMRERRRLSSSKHAGQAYLAPGRGEQVLSPNHQVDALLQIIHHDRELIRPVAETILHEQISALPCWILFLLSQNAIVEAFESLLDRHPNASSGSQLEVTLATASRIANLLIGRLERRPDLLTRAVAGVHLVHGGQSPERCLVPGAAVVFMVGPQTTEKLSS